ncbi:MULTISPECIES: LacI family DNA-binding transcriptional regulator [Paenibacillus]|uniref:LacI family transcriptional regulator n=1 Tax=Paenibacillus vini TaxID=1476024 RepID=A0ABQ4M5P9_9BACL|nr:MULTISPECIES: LacI family DNA-binding transcriptional regulator [Paenibacillus]MBQ4900531.1 LacI family DNA-binding transcriptional regulator [Paenibacillus sp. Marseille-P2973]GIP51331.1 LacI family transcriptional regulator [Paenibacillus vini]
MEQERRLTIKELAKQIGVSVATLDRVLNNRGNVKRQTYDKVMDKIKELNYMPNKSASFLSRMNDYSMAIVFPELPEYFWKQVEKGVQIAIDEFRDYGLNVTIIRSEKYDLDPQKKIVQQLIDSGKYDAIALSPNDPQEMADLIDRGVDQGIAICTFNSDSPLSKRLFYVGCDYRIAGRLAADALCKFLGGKTRVGLVMSYTNFQMQQKVTGFREVVAEYDHIEMVGPLKLSQEDYESPEAFADYFRQADGIYVSSARLDVVAKHLEEYPAENRPVLIGHDMTDETYQYMKKGIVTATICQDPVNQGYLTVKSMFDHLVTGDKVGMKENITKLELVTRENARYYI